MIHYHGSPITPADAAARILPGRHAMVSFARNEQLPLVAAICQSFVLDNGAFSFWKAQMADGSEKPKHIWNDYYEWVGSWRRHPGFDWAVIPDVIDGSEAENDNLLSEWPFSAWEGVPVWHLNESLSRLQRLATTWPRVAFGSSGRWATVGTSDWWNRMAKAMEVLCDGNGQPVCRLHGLRMLNPKVFTRLPFASADSTNIARNIKYDSAWRGTYTPSSKAVRGIVLAERIEGQQSSERWEPIGIQMEMALEEVGIGDA